MEIIGLVKYTRKRETEFYARSSPMLHKFINEIQLRNFVYKTSVYACKGEK